MFLQFVFVFIGIFTTIIPSCNGFFLSKPKGGVNGGKGKVVISPLTDDAITIFNKNFPFDRPPVQSSPLSTIGMPYADIDGTILKKKNSIPGKRLTDISKQQAIETFNELARLYGDQAAYEMVKALPICLVFNKKKFAPSFIELSNIFGEEKAKAMVTRNPGLLAITPEDAAAANEQTMVFSYVIGYTRPFGPVLLPGLILALFSPAIEAITGIPIHSAFLALFAQ